MTQTTDRTKPRAPSTLPEHRVPGRTYNLSEAQKAAALGVSASMLQKDRLKEKPAFDFARVGGLVRYSSDVANR